MKKPYISIIVPVYKAVSTLHRCLDSILAQTYTNFELLLIDDGSPDNSGQICDDYAVKENRIKVFHKENGGASSARNVGLDNARGEWITFCDADDWVYPCWLDNYINNLPEDCDLVIQGFETDKDLNQYATYSGIHKFGINYTGSIAEGIKILHHNPVRPFIWCKLFKQSIIKQESVRFDVRFNHAEDDEFIVRYMSYCKNMNCTDLVGYYYNVPDYKVKYPNKKNLFYLRLSIYQNSYKINEESEISSHYLYLLNCFLLYSFKIKSEDRKELLRTYRTQIGKNIFRSNMFILTKWAIYLDPTYLFSSLVLNLHVKLKSLDDLKKAAVW